MRKIVLAALAVLSIAPAAAAGYDWYGPGETITYDKLVDKPNVVIKYASYQQGTGELTLMLLREDGSSNPGRAQVSLKRRDSIDIAVKNECVASACRSYVVTLTFRDFTAYDLKVKLTYDVKIVPTVGN